MNPSSARDANAKGKSGGKTWTNESDKSSSASLRPSLPKSPIAI
jgi:hypothetical protein